MSVGGGRPESSGHEQSTFTAFVEPHWAAMTTLARRLGGTDWEDVLQDSLALAWRRRASFDETRAPARTWLLMLVHDQANKGARRAQRRRSVLVDLAVDEPQTQTEARVDVDRALAKLAARQRLVVELYYFLDLSVAEVAAVMSTSVGTVKSTLSDARRRLHDALEERDHDRSGH